MKRAESALSLARTKPSVVADGIQSTLTSDMWLTSLSGSDYIVFDLGANYDVTNLHVWNYFETGAALRGINSVSISYDTTVAGNEFTSAGSYEFASEIDGSGSDIAISTMTNARLVRFDVNSTHGSVYYVGLSEVQFTSAVPEASTWGVIAGLVSLGVVAWHKRFSKRN